MIPILRNIAGDGSDQFADRVIHEASSVSVACATLMFVGIETFRST